MAPPSSSRRLSWNAADAAGAGAGAELSRPRRRWQSVVLQVRVLQRRKTAEGLFGFRRIMDAEFRAMLQTLMVSMLRRVVSEEVEKAMFRQLSAPPPAAPPRLLVAWNQRPRYELVFLNGPKQAYTMMKVEPENGAAIKVAIVERFDNNQTKIVRFGPLSSVRAEVVVLHGHFNARNEESWNPEEFNGHIVSSRAKSAQLLTGDLTLKLNGGEGFLENLTFTDNSSFTSTKKFRLGLRLVNPSGDRVLEGVTKPFRVKERRVEVFEKHYPPTLDDEVWRLEKIGKTGPYYQALSDNGIKTVQQFLQAYMKDGEKLIKTFSKMAKSTWKSIIEHAMTCKLGDSLYLYDVKDKETGLFFDEIYQLVGVKFGDDYKPIDQLNPVEKNSVESLKEMAYQNMDALQCNYKMVNNRPVPQYFHDQGTSMLGVLPNQQILNYGQHNSYLGDTSTDQGFRSSHSGENLSISQGSNNVPVDVSRFVQGQTSNDLQFRHEQTYSSTQGIIFPAPRITQLQIPNPEITYFGPDVTPAFDSSDILVSEATAPFDQHRQSEQSQLSKASYSCPPVNSLSSMDVGLPWMQSQWQLPRNSESFGNNSGQQYSDQTIMQSRQVVAGFQTSRTNSFDFSCDEMIQSFISQISNNEVQPTPLSPRRWVKIRAALKLATVGRLSRASRRGLYGTPPRPRLIPTI